MGTIIDLDVSVIFKCCPCPQNITFVLQQCFFKLDFIYLFLEREEERETEMERNISVWLPLTWPPLGT